MATQFTPETIGKYFSPEEQQLIKGLSFQGGVSQLGGGMTQYFTSGGRQYATNVPGGGDYVENYKAFLNTIKSGKSDTPVATPGTPIPTQTAGQPQAVSTVPPATDQQGRQPGTDPYQFFQGRDPNRPTTSEIEWLPPGADPFDPNAKWQFIPENDPRLNQPGSTTRGARVGYGGQQQGQQPGSQQQQQQQQGQPRFNTPSGYFPQSFIGAQSSYSGPSIVDYLRSVGKPDNFETRKQYADILGIKNYTGTAEQNTQMLGLLKSGASGQLGANTAANGPNQAPGATSGYTPTPAIPGQDYAAYEASQGFPQTGTQTAPGSQGAQGTPDNKVAGAETQVDPLQPLRDLLSSYGITPNVAQAAANPLGTFDDVYKKVYNELGLADVKTHIDNLTKRLAENDQKISDKISNINSNPWLSEGARVKQVNAATKGNQLARANILNELRLNESEYEKGRLDARYAAHETVTQLNQNRNFDLKELEYRINLAEKQFEANQKLQERKRTEAETESRFERSQAATESRFRRSQEIKVQQKAEKADVIGKLEKTLGNLKTLGQTRQEAESKFKKDNGVGTIAPNVKSVFDKVFGVEAQKKPWWQIW